ncbi:MAG: hypothetical protein KF882_02610 [Bacteroidia bacterium]|nr:hypothetical protein [Bacteroidia bacterium]MCO5253597.1 hypothetical protein [Bacteroidota bacterium]
MKSLLQIIFYLLSISLIISCNNSNCNQDNKILLFNKIFYQLDEGESIGNIKKQDISEFEKIIKSKDCQIPLFKKVTAKNYTTYIGLPFETSFEEVFNSRITDSEPIEEVETQDFIFNKYKIKEQYIFEYFRRFNDNLIYIITSSYDSTTSIDKLNFEFLNSKLYKND